MATSIAILRCLQHEKLINLSSVSYTAGHSLGEYSSLVATNSLDFKDAVKILKVRSEAMQESMPIGTGGMAAIIGSSLSQISKLLPELNEIGKIYVANDNADGQIVLSGEIRAIDPPKPDLAIPNKIIAGTTVKKNKRFISIYLLNPVVLTLEDL